MVHAELAATNVWPRVSLVTTEKPKRILNVNKIRLDSWLDEFLSGMHQKLLLKFIFRWSIFLNCCVVFSSWIQSQQSVPQSANFKTKVLLIMSHQFNGKAFLRNIATPRKEEMLRQQHKEQTGSQGSILTAIQLEAYWGRRQIVFLSVLFLFSTYSTVNTVSTVYQR
jgi:hypothetical protein